MCVVSMVIDWRTDEWFRRYYPQSPEPSLPIQPPPVSFPTQTELEEFRRLLERAREYDRRMNQPDCELEEKRQKLLKMAEELGVKIDFV